MAAAGIQPAPLPSRHSVGSFIIKDDEKSLKSSVRSASFILEVPRNLGHRKSVHEPQTGGLKHLHNGQMLGLIGRKARMCTMEAILAVGGRMVSQRRKLT
jgi:hypothetical protein